MKKAQFLNFPKRVTHPMNIDLARRFRGIERLYGLQNTERIKRAHICVIGVGGVGSWVVEALARSGIGALTLIDLDQIAESNVNRQIMALTSQLGRAKVTVLRNRVYDINPAAQVEVIEDFVETDNYQEFFQRSFDFVIDAIDNLKVKAFLADYFVKKGQAFVVAGAAGGKSSSAFIDYQDLSLVHHDRLLASLRYHLRRQFAFPGRGLMQVPCVYSSEEAKSPQGCETKDLENGLSCAGYGSSMIVTAAFALRLSEVALNHIMSTTESKIDQQSFMRNL